MTFNNVLGIEKVLEASFGEGGGVVVQSESLDLPTGAEDRGRALVRLTDGRTLHAGRFGGVHAVVVLRPDGTLDRRQGEGGVISFPQDALGSQLFDLALSPDATHVAATRNADANGALLVVLEVDAP